MIKRYNLESDIMECLLTTFDWTLCFLGLGIIFCCSFCGSFWDVEDVFGRSRPDEEEEKEKGGEREKRGIHRQFPWWFWSLLALWAFPKKEGRCLPWIHYLHTNACFCLRVLLLEINSPAFLSPRFSFPHTTSTSSSTLLAAVWPWLKRVTWSIAARPHICDDGRQRCERSSSSVSSFHV